MTKILSSATKICLIGFSAAIIAALFTGKVSGEQFMTIATMIFSFYFGQKINLDPKTEE